MIYRYGDAAFWDAFQEAQPVPAPAERRGGYSRFERELVELYRAADERGRMSIKVGYMAAFTEFEEKDRQDGAARFARSQLHVIE